MKKASLEENKKENESIFRKTGSNTIYPEKNKKTDRFDYKNINENRKRDLKMDKNNNLENFNSCKKNSMNLSCVARYNEKDYDSKNLSIDNSKDSQYTNKMVMDKFLKPKNLLNSFLKDSLFGNNDYLPREPNEEDVVGNNIKNRRNSQDKNKNNKINIKDTINAMDLINNSTNNTNNGKEDVNMNSNIKTNDYSNKDYFGESNEIKVENNSKKIKDNNKNIKDSILTNDGLKTMGIIQSEVSLGNINGSNIKDSILTNDGLKIMGIKSSIGSISNINDSNIKDSILTQDGAKIIKKQFKRRNSSSRNQNDNNLMQNTGKFISTSKDFAENKIKNQNENNYNLNKKGSYQNIHNLNSLNNCNANYDNKCNFPKVNKSEDLTKNINKLYPHKI